MCGESCGSGSFLAVWGMRPSKDTSIPLPSQRWEEKGRKMPPKPRAAPRGILWWGFLLGGGGGDMMNNNLHQGPPVAEEEGFIFLYVSRLMIFCVRALTLHTHSELTHSPVSSFVFPSTAYKEKMKEISVLSFICSCLYPETHKNIMGDFEGTRRSDFYQIF